MSNELSLWNDNNSLSEIRQKFAPNLSDTEFSLLVQMGKATGLNPFLREIWAVKYDSRNPAQIFIGRDGYRKGAQSHPDYRGHSAFTICENDKLEIINGDVHHRIDYANRGELIGAFCIVKRKNCMPIFCDVKRNEYDSKRSLWANKPETMLKKVAEAQALRMAFQEIFAGSYEEAEMSHKLSKDIEPADIIEHKVSLEQMQRINELVIEKNVDPARVAAMLSYFKVNAIEMLTERQAEKAIRGLEK